MLFLACGLFDASNGASSTPTTAQASSEELVREAFAEFDRAEEYYATSPHAQESIYVDKLLEKYLNEHKNTHDPMKIKELNREIKNLKDIQKNHTAKLNQTSKNEALKLYDQITQAEKKLDELSKTQDSRLLEAFYVAVGERYKDKGTKAVIDNLPDLIKARIGKKYIALFDELIEDKAEFYKDLLSKTSLLINAFKLDKLPYKSIEINFTDINEHITKLLLPEEEQESFNNKMAEEAKKEQHWRQHNGLSNWISTIESELKDGVEVDQLAKLLKEQKISLPVYMIKDLIGDFFSKGNHTLLDLIQRYSSDMMNLHGILLRSSYLSDRNRYEYSNNPKRFDTVKSNYLTSRNIDHEFPDYSIINNHKIDSDLQLYRWFVEAENI